jgi:pyruvate dehydrogenase E2 component (dihydrolipoamide acetyltransferase)
VPIEIVMPRLSDTMEDGRILRWLKAPGDSVSRGDVIAEVETDKADMELEAEASGVVDSIVVEEGGSAAVGAVIAKLREADGDEDAAPPAKKAKAATDEAAPEPEPEEEGEDEPGDEPPAAEEKPAKKSPPPPSAKKGEPGRHKKPILPPGAGDKPKPTPVAARMAEDAGVDPTAVSGSGAAGRVTKADVERAKSEPPARPAARRGEGPQRETLSNVRRAVGRRMTESKKEVPHFYLSAEIEMSGCVALKKTLDRAAGGKSGVTYTHVIARASALALLEHPRVNARFVDGETIEFPAGVNVGLAVALDEGLVVAVVHDCDAKDLQTIAIDARAAIERVRAGKPRTEDVSGGTFTISNLGMFAVDDFSAVINPPQAAILATGSVRERPIVRDGSVVAAPTLRVTLSCDHRVIDGADGARFLSTLKELLEEPVRLFL